MNFRGWRKTSLLEYPGKISTVLFTGGCNFRCPFCYNTQLVQIPERLIAISVEEVLRYLRENRRLYQAVAVTGGEPTLHEDLPAFLKSVRDAGFAVGLETNGTNPGMLEELIEDDLVSRIAMDVKTVLKPSKYAEAAGVTDPGLFRQVLRSIELLKNGSCDYEFRVTLVPGLHTEEVILTLAKQLEGARHFVLQQFVDTETLDGETGRRKPFPPSFLHALEAKVGRIVSCSVREP